MIIHRTIAITIICSIVILTCAMPLAAQNGFHWTKTSFQVTGAGSIAGIVSQGNSIFAATTGMGVFRSNDNGTTWKPANNGLTSLETQSITIDRNNVLYVGTNGGAGVYRSADGGATWSPFNTGLGTTNIQAITAGPDGNLIAGVSTGIAVVPRNGSAWTRPQSISKQIWTVATDYSGNAFAAAPTGENYRSTDYGATWKPMNLSAQGVTFIKPRNDGSGIVFAAASGVYRSTDNGATWSSTMASDIVTSVTTSGTSMIYAATSDGVFTSIDNGDHWVPTNEGFDSPVTFSTIAFSNSSTPYLLGGTFGGLIYRTTIGQLDADDAVAGMTNRLSQNFPNPCAARTTIPFDLSHAANISLSLYDLTGHAIANLFSGHLDAGHHETFFDASGYPNGVYFYRLHAGDHTETRTLTIER
ncbi:MAG: T9SS type A sorting domain-containing protein [Candidatus Kapaibacterium sp.]